MSLKIDRELYQEKKCTYSLKNHERKVDPHFHTILKPRPLICKNILEVVGNTPMVRLNKIPQSFGIKCEIYAKLEYMNPGGASKDRIAKRMIEEAEKQGIITPGKSKIIEATSGNTGIGLAMVGAIKGYDVIITLPEKMSQEKSDILKGLGATIIRTPPVPDFTDENSHYGVARKMKDQIKDSIILDQFTNPGNSLAHYDETAEEIWMQTEGKIDAVVISAGTGGGITGIGRKLKEKDQNIQVIGVDPHGSILAFPEKLNYQGKFPYMVEGIGNDFIPKNCDTKLADKWFKISDKDSFVLAKRLIREEGLLCGASCGTVLAAALEYCKDLPADKKVVVYFVDSIRNYMSKFLNDDWMLENNFYTQEEYDLRDENKYLKSEIFGENMKISDLELNKVEVVNIESMTYEVLEKFKNSNSEFLPVSDSKSEIVGIITSRQILNYLTSFKITVNGQFKKAIIKEFKKLQIDQSLKYLSKAFNRHQFVLVEGINGYYAASHHNLLRYFLEINK